MNDLWNLWTRSHLISLILLWPLSLIFRLISWIRRFLYYVRIFKVYQTTIPIIIVGNISVGGTGKTPLVIWLSNYFKRLGYQPSVILRGYRGKVAKLPILVKIDSDPNIVGDEAIVIARNTPCPVYTGSNRANIVQDILKTHTNCNLVISDDGLQHYALARDIEIIVVDGERKFGNSFLLPAGPLREGYWRLQRSDFIVINGDTVVTQQREYNMYAYIKDFINIKTRKIYKPNRLRQQAVHAVAGIGNPKRFFNMLLANKITINKTIYPNHYKYNVKDIMFDDTLPVIMTEKDAVKCHSFVTENHWYMRFSLYPDKNFVQTITNKLKEYTVE